MSVADTAAVPLRTLSPDPFVGLGTRFQAPVQPGADLGEIDGRVWTGAGPAARCSACGPPNLAGKLAWTLAGEVDGLAQAANATAFDRLQTTVAAISAENPLLISLPPCRHELDHEVESQMP
jgi:hypothetical protein